MQSNFIQTRDLRMHYLQAGTGDPLIFIHGFPETSYEWRHQLAYFSQSYACFAPEFCGRMRLGTDDTRFCINRTNDSAAILKLCRIESRNEGRVYDRIAGIPIDRVRRHQKCDRAKLSSKRQVGVFGMSGFKKTLAGWLIRSW